MDEALEEVVRSSVPHASASPSVVDRLMSAASPVGMAVYAGDGRIVRCNVAAERILGLTESQILGRTCLDPRWRAIHEDGTDFPGGTHPALVALRTGDPVVDVLMGVHRPDGSLTWISVNATPVADEPSDSEPAVLETFTDITAQVHQRDEARESQERYRLLAENASDVVVRISDGGIIEWMSPSVTAMLGWTPQDWLGRPSTEIVVPEDVDKVRAGQRAVMAGEHVRFRARVRHRDGGFVWIESRAHWIESDGEPRARVASWRDVTEQVRLDELLRQEREQYQTLAENASDVVLQFRPDGHIAWVSASITTMLGWTPEQVLGSDSLDLIHPDDVAAVIANRADVEAGVSVGLRVRVRCSRPGEYHWVQAQGKAIRSAEGQLIGRAGAWRDIAGEVAAEERLREERERFRLIAENASDVVWQLDVDGTLTWVSPSMEHVLGWKPADLLGTRARDLLHPDDLPHADAARESLVARRDVHDLRCRFRGDNGGYTWMSVHAKVTPSAASGDPPTVVGSLRDITAEVTAQDAVASATALFRTAMASAAIGMALADENRRFVVVNQALCTLLGHDEDWFLNHHLIDVVHPDDRETALAQGDLLLHSEGDGSVLGEVRVVRADGALRWVRRVGALVRAGPAGENMLMLQIEDVTAEREAREQLAFHAYHDALTGLHNRTWILDTLDTDLRTATDDGTAVGVLFIDLDNFKVVNDSLGHIVGDTVLEAIARRIAGSLQPGDRIGRFGGDEFIVVIPGVHKTTEVERTAARISAAISTELLVEGRRIVSTASIGIAMSAQGSTSTSLLRDADAAVFRAKAAGRSRWQFFDADMHDQALERITLEEEIRTALTRGEFVVHYQPIVDLADAVVVGHEALVRWEHPDRGLLAPSAFLPTAEQSGLVVEIGDQVLESVCTLLATCPDLPGPISVNKSPVQISRPGWKDRFLAIIGSHDVDPRRLVIELTETAIMSVDGFAAQDLQELRELGIGIHVDDFGTGYSSISLLRDLPVTGLKLDLSFTRHVTTDETARILAAGLAGLADGLQLDAVAEGIETAAQAAALRSQGWKHGQGWLYGRPAPDPAHGRTFPH